MNKAFKKGDKISIEERLNQRQNLIKPFIKKYNKPVLVHSVHDKKTFKKILKQGKLRLPKEHNGKKKTPYMERILGIDNCIYLSLGFIYASAYDFKYSLIFDLDYLKELDYYKNSISYRCYKDVIIYLDKYNPKVLEKFSKENKKTKEVMNKFYNEKYKGKTKEMFDFWKIEKETFEMIVNHPQKKKLKEIIKKRARKYLIKYPCSVRQAKKDYCGERAPEIISRRQIKLKDNPYFLGFYIKGKIPQDILIILKKNYSKKIFFDDKKIKNIEYVEK